MNLCRQTPSSWDRRVWETRYSEGEHINLALEDFATIVFTDDEENDPKFLSENVVDAYAECIVRYRNQVFETSVMKQFEEAQQRYAEARGRRPERQHGANRRHSRSMSPLRGREAPNTRIRDSDPLPQLTPPAEPVGPHVQVGFILSETWRNALSPEALRNNGATMASALVRMLENLKFTPQSILALDYLFIPFYHWEKEHHLLMGIAPKQGFVFIIDSCSNTYPRDAYPVEALLALAFLVCPPEIKWPVYGLWQSRGWKEDDSPNCARQGDYHNCGVFTCTNMMCLAFGYRLMCYRQRDLNIGKRHRMAAELGADGFGPPPFDYQLLDLPTSVAAHRTDYRYTLPEVTREADVKGRAPQKQYPSTRIPFNLMLKEDQVPFPEPDPEEQWPSQFSTYYHRTAGFVYKVPLGVSNEHTVSKFSIVGACRFYGIKGWKIWSREPLGMFRRWFLNEVAGHVSRLQGGLIPMGYGEDLKWKAKKDTAALKADRDRRIQKIKLRKGARK